MAPLFVLVGGLFVLGLMWWMQRASTRAEADRRRAEIDPRLAAAQEKVKVIQAPNSWGSPVVRSSEVLPDWLDEALDAEEAKQRGTP